MVGRREIKGGLREASGDEATVMRSALPRFLALYATLFAAFGVASPFFGAFLAGRGLRPEAIGLVLAAGTAVRLVAGPAGGRVADRLGSASGGAGGLCGGGGVRGVRLPARRGGLGAPADQRGACAMLAPLTPIADALTLGEAGALKEAGPGDASSMAGCGARGRRRSSSGTLLSGQAVARFGLAAIIWLNGVLLGVAAWCAWRVPDLLARSASARAGTGGRGGVVAASAGVPPPDAGGGIDPGQPRAA